MEEPFILNGPEFAYDFPEGMTMGDLMYNKLLEYGKNVAQIQIETGEQLHFDEILNESCKLAIYLKNQNIKVNDRVAICCENNLNFTIPVCASLFVGATLCPINPVYTQNEFKHTLNISKPSFIFVSPTSLKSIQYVMKELSWSPTLILIFGDSTKDVPTISKLTKNVQLSSVKSFAVTKVDPKQHVMGILCSSGTTGLPKGVMLTEKNYLTTVRNFLDPNVNFVSKDQPLVHLLPFFHTYCFNTLIIGLIIGAHGIVFSHFNEQLFLETIEKYKVKTLTLVPPIMVFLTKHPSVKNYNLSSVINVWCGAAPLSSETEASVKNVLKNAEIRQGYGMTELTFCVTYIPTGNSNSKPGSTGKLISGIKAKVVPILDNNKWSDKALGPNEEGELCFKGDLVMLGYCNDKSSTSATIDKDGWLHTGDIGYYDKDGFFYVVDRLKELIKYKGFQVAPAELETILLNHPQIKDAAVIGQPNEEAGELPFAFIVKQPNSKITAADVLKYVEGQVSNYKRLRGGVKFLEYIPKNATGKILRRELRNLLKSNL